MTFLLIWATVGWDCPWYAKGEALKQLVCERSVKVDYLLSKDASAIQSKLSALGPGVSARVIDLGKNKQLNYKWSADFRED